MTNFQVPTVSVIIPTFNSAPTIRRALCSIQDQTMPVNEVIVVDDASKDSTVEIVRQFSRDFPDLDLTILVNEINSGPGICRNTGWNLARGDFICFLDADDSWHSQKIELQLRWMFEHQSVMICGTLHSIGPVEPDLSTQSSSSFTLRQLMTRNRFTTPSVMIRRTVHLRFDESLRRSEDYLLWMRIAATYGAVYRLDTPLTFLHKAIYGASGLSSNLVPMFVGEVKAIRLLRHYHHISRLQTCSAITWSTLKFIQRTPRSIFRLIFGKVIGHER